MKKGLDPEALTGKYPVSYGLFCKVYDIYLLNFQPKIQVASKYERRVDTRSYVDKKKLFEGVSIVFSTFKPELNHFSQKKSRESVLSKSYFKYMPGLYLQITLLLIYCSFLAILLTCEEKYDRA